MPHVHPGRDKYGRQSESLRRVLSLTWMATIVLADYMIEAVMNTDESKEMEVRFEFCNAVIARFEKEAELLVRELNRAKDKLREEWRESNPPHLRISPERRSEISRETAVVCNL
jgi:hypothetical protein